MFDLLFIRKPSERHASPYGQLSEGMEPGGHLLAHNSFCISPLFSLSLNPFSRPKRNLAANPRQKADLPSSHTRGDHLVRTSMISIPFAFLLNSSILSNAHGQPVPFDTQKSCLPAGTAPHRLYVKQACQRASLLNTLPPCGSLVDAKLDPSRPNFESHTDVTLLQ